MSVFTEAVEKFEKYKAPSGLYSLYTDGTKGQETQNGALFTVECYLVLRELVLNGDEHALVVLYQDVYDALEKLNDTNYPGVYRRSPGSNETNSFDNVVAHVALSFTMADQILQHGKNVKCTGNSSDSKLRWLAFILGGFKTRYFWHCEAPTLYNFFGWHGRSPAYMGLLYARIGKILNPWHALAVLVGQFAGSWRDPGDTDARKLPYITWYWLKDRNWFWKFAYKMWCKVLMSKYPGGMKEVYNAYYSDRNHPIHLYSTKFSE